MSDNSTSPPRFAKLNDVNYAEWSVYMEAELIRKGLWSLIEIPITEKDADDAFETKKAERDAQKMAEARAEMILRVEGTQLPHMRSRDPMEVWESLQTVHQARGFATTLSLRRKLGSMKKKPTQSMQSWISEIRSIGFRLADAGAELTDQDMVLSLTSGLPSSYDSLIVSFDSVAEITLDEVIIRLLNEETRQTTSRSITTRSNPASYSSGDVMLDEAHAVNPTCYFCNQIGHVKIDCKDRKAWEAYKKSNSSQSAHLVEEEEVANAFDYDTDSEAGFC